MQRWQKTMMGLALAAGLSTGIFAEAGAAETAAADGLDAKERAVVAMAATTETGDLANLEKYLTAGLDAGLTVNEIKEVLVQLYAYTGFPRSLNAIDRFMAVTKARADAGIQDELGREPSPRTNTAPRFAPSSAAARKSPLSGLCARDRHVPQGTSLLRHLHSRQS